MTITFSHVPNYLLKSDGTAIEAKEKSTIAITASFEDEDGNDVTPTEATWTLTDDNGAVINSREQVDIGSLSTSVTVVLSGDDLQILSAEASENNATRRFLIEATYDSSLGSDLPLKNSCVFPVRNFKYVT